MNASSPRDRAEFILPEAELAALRREREREERIQARAADPNAVLTPGATPWAPAPWKVQAERDALERAAALAQLERDMSAQRHHVRQLALVAQDLGVNGGSAYAAQHKAAEAALQQMEARAAAIQGGAPL